MTPRRALAFLAASSLLALSALRADDAAPVTDPAQVAAHYREVAARPEFVDGGEPLATPHLEEMLSQWFKSLGSKIGSFKYASRMPAFESLLMSCLVILSVSVLLYTMVRLTRRRARMDPEVSETAAGPRTLRPPEFYDEQIARAAGAGDWHAAWLAAWRQFLSRLEHGDLVEADRTRTTREYLRQLAARPLPGPALPLLNGVVDAYDRFIYGRTAIAEEDWARFRAQLGEAALLLHLDERKTPAAP
jgi:hypothetical protein